MTGTGTHLHLVVLVDLLAGARGRWETHVLEGDLTLRLPAGTEEEGRHIGKGARENLFTDIHIAASLTCRITHLFSNATVTKPSWTSFTKACGGGEGGENNGEMVTQSDTTIA